MIFKPELADKIMKSEKTQTRRIVKPGEWSTSKSVYSRRDRVKWRVGQTYAVQPGRTKAAIGRFLLLGIRQERLQEISESDAQAELGAPDWTGSGEPPYRRDLITCFFDIWNRINNKPGQRVEDNPEVWVLVFERVK